MRAAVLRLSAVALGTAIALILGEVLLRLFEPGPPPTRPSPPEWRTINPIDPNFRTVAPTARKRPGAFRILVLGDSFTWGWRVPPAKTYVSQLTRKLRDHAPSRVLETVNWSRSGWNTWEEWRSIRNRLEEWNPDLLLLGFVLNDADPTNPKERERRWSQLRQRTPEAPAGAALYASSRLFRRLYDAFEARRSRTMMVDYYRSLYRADGWRKARTALRRLHQEAARLKIPFLVIVFPIFESDLDDGYAYRDLHTLVCGAVRELGTRCLDLLPAYEGMDGRSLAVEPFVDAHPSKLAHRVAARRIFRYLVDERLVPNGADEAGGG